MTATLSRNRGPETEPKITTREVIREVAKHAGVSYDEAADVIYAFLHYIKYAALATEQNILMRNFGTFYLSRTKGRIYGQHVNAPTYRPDRMKIAITSELVEVDRWKNMQSIHRTVAAALDAKLQPYSMDLSVCARIADQILSNKPINEISGQSKVEYLREWIYATGATPLLPTVTFRQDNQGREYHILKFRLGGQERTIATFDFEPELIIAAAAIDGARDLVFTPTGWVCSRDVRIEATFKDTKDPVPEKFMMAYGTSIEDQCKSLYKAYKAVKYGKDQS